MKGTSLIKRMSSPRKVLFGGFGACACALAAAATVFACTNIVPYSTITLNTYAGSPGTSVTATGKGLTTSAPYTLDFVDPSLVAKNYSAGMSCANPGDEVLAAGMTDASGDITSTGTIPAVTETGTANICFISVGAQWASPNVTNFSVSVI